MKFQHAVEITRLPAPDNDRDKLRGNDGANGNLDIKKPILLHK
ncbi:hypothetical protein [Marivirga lumbricoides]